MNKLSIVRGTALRLGYRLCWLEDKRFILIWIFGLFFCSLSAVANRGKWWREGIYLRWIKQRFFRRWFSARVPNISGTRDWFRGSQFFFKLFYLLIFIFGCVGSSLEPTVTQMVKNLSAMQTWVRSLGWEDPLEKGMATHSTILAWKIWATREALWKTVFPRMGWEDGFGKIQVPYIYCALYFYYYYISYTSDYQALDPRGWGPLV